MATDREPEVLWEGTLDGIQFRVAQWPGQEAMVQTYVGDRHLGRGWHEVDGCEAEAVAVFLAAERSRLERELGEARRILRSLEWSGWTHLCEDEGRDGCPECKSFKAGSLSEADIVDFGSELRDYEGRHAASCELGALLARLEAKDA